MVACLALADGPSDAVMGLALGDYKPSMDMGLRVNTERGVGASPSGARCASDVSTAAT